MMRPIDTSPLVLSPSSEPIQTRFTRQEEYFHIPGQNAAIRFFEAESMGDFNAMRAILKGKQTRRWMEDVLQLSKTEYQEWAGTHDLTTFLFSIHDARVDPGEEMPIRGFVYLYNEFKERRRVSRLVERGFILPTEGQALALEISFAARPTNEGSQSGSGLVSSAVRQACLEIRAMVKPTVTTDLLIFAFVDRENLPSHRTMESAGFIKRGNMKYDPDSSEADFVYTLDWPLLEEKIRSRL